MGLDWSKVVEMLFRVAFACLNKARGDERAAKVVRRVHDRAYNRMSGSPDSGTPPRPPAGPALEMAP